MNARLPHISFITLADLAEGRVAPSERAALELHLRACSRCAADHEWLERTVALLRADDLVDAPPALINQAIGLFRTQQDPKQPDVLRRIVAALSFDSGLTQAAFGVRSGLPGTRQLLYSAEPYELDLRVAQLDGAFALSGQVLGPCDGGDVELRGPERVSAHLSDLCDWKLEPIPPGLYELVLRLGDAEVAVRDLSLEV